METIGKGYYRKESYEKVTGKAKYTNDFETRGILHAKMLEHGLLGMPAALGNSLSTSLSVSY
ncbi:hypothetical protein [Cytobacillus dafuensis]|uniref:hypothetical protein n=1 Tax=Cytobacillus dafuensis TaxID=1742359 RepID=UPI0007108736